MEKPFDFYGFGIRLGIEDQIDIANRAYIRFYKKRINDVLMDKEAVETELQSNVRLLNKFKTASESSARKIKELEIKEQIVQQERITLKLEADRKVQKISKEYVEIYKQLAQQFQKYKDFIVFELESHEMVKENLEKVIQKKEDYIDDLKEALSVPRQHYKHIDNLQADEIIKQKEIVIAEMADNMGVPQEKLLDIMYKAEAAREAKNQVKKALEEDARAAAAEAGEDGTQEAASPTKPDGAAEKLGADASQ